MSQNFYFLQCHVIHPAAELSGPIDKGNRTPWTNGKKLNHTPPDPIIYTMKCSDLSEEEQEAADLRGVGPDDFNISFYSQYQDPELMHKDLLTTIRTAGDITIESFNVEIQNPISGTIHRDYCAINVIGVAEFEVERELRKIPTRRDFKLPVDSYLLFRLHEDGPIVIHESVKEAIEKADFPGIYFTPTYENY